MPEMTISYCKGDDKMPNEQFDSYAIEIIAKGESIAINTIRVVTLTTDGDYAVVDTVHGCAKVIYDKEQVIADGSNDMENWFDLDGVAGTRYIRIKRKVQSTKRFGLPTFPINHGMRLGSRKPDELEWLLDHGHFQTDITNYLKITKVSNVLYKLFKNEGAWPGRDDEQLVEATTLQALLVRDNDTIALSAWYWYGNLE